MAAEPPATGPDRVIGSLAIVKANYDHDRSFLESFARFLRHCLAQVGTETASGPELQACIAQEFGLQLPQAVIKTLLRREERRGGVVRDKASTASSRRRSRMPT